MTRKVILVFFLVLSLFIFLPARSTVNRSIRVDNGESIRDNLSTVNGGIHIGRQCRISGSARTVNGGIRVGDGSSVHALKTVNGRIRMGKDVRISGRVHTVNGGIHAGRGCEIRGSVSTVNGGIDLEGTRVVGDIITTTSHITLEDGTRVTGDILIKKRGWSFFDIFRSRLRLRIRVRGNSVVEGDIVNRARRTEVTVFLEEGGILKGRVINARLEKRLILRAGGLGILQYRLDFPRT